MKETKILVHHSGTKPLGTATVMRDDDGRIFIRYHVTDPVAAEFLRSGRDPFDYVDDEENDDDEA